MKTTSPLSRPGRLVLAGLLATGALFAQAQAPRIHNAINAAEVTVLQGSKHPLANPQYDAGRVPADTKMQGVTLYFSRSAAQQAELNALLAAQQDPSSPQYHQWLTPEQFATRFGMAQSDIDQVQSWLQQQGFSIDSVMHSRTGIRFSGTAGQVESAFQTQMHYYTVRGEKHMAPSTDLSVPAALGKVVLGVRNLDDFRPRPQHIVPRRNFTSGQSGNVFFAPPDIVTAYDIQPLISAGIDGTGQTIAIMGQSYVNVSDVEAFESAAGLTKKDPQLVLMPGTGNDQTFSKGDEGESDLDLEWSGAIAPGANIVFVYTGSNTKYGVYDSVQYAVDNKIGNIISLSYSSCETELTTSTYTQLDAIFQQAASQGQTVMAASGDQGSTSCYGDTHLTTAQQQTIMVNYPASSQYVTGVGGTEIVAANGVDPTTGAKGANYSTYWNSQSGTDLVNSLKQYVPEVAWNDDPTSSSQGCPTTQNCLSSTGGGKSTLVPQPKYQSDYFSATGEANPDSSHRLVPDISFYSSPELPGFLYCTSDQSDWNTGATPPQNGSCTSGFRDTTSQGWLTVAGGTSFATPIFAGMVALLNENGKFVTGAGNVNTMLYNLAANSSTYGSVFHDVTSGNNDCETPWNCATTGSATGFAAGTNYDMATGLGSIDVGKMAALWTNSASTASLIPTTVTVTPASTTPAVNTNDVFTITVSSQTGGTPSGSVTLQIDGGTSLGGTTLTNQTLDANGTVTYTGNFTTGGTHQVLAEYSGDTTHAAATGVGEVIIPGGGTGKGSIAMSASPGTLTVSRGSTGNETVTLTPSGGYTGTVNFTYSTSNDTALTNLCVFAGTGFDTSGNLAVSGTSAVSATVQIDTNAADCTSSTTGRLGAHGLRLLPRSGSAHASNSKPKGPKSSIPGELAFAGLLLAGLLGRHSHKLRNLACVIALAAAAFAISACGSSSGVNNGPSDPAKGSYTITFQGQDSTTSTISAQTSFTLVID